MKPSTKVLRQRFAHATVLVLFPVGVCFIILEYLAPQVITVPHLVYRFWGDRPATYYPDMWQRAATNEYDVRFRSNLYGFKDIDHKLLKPTDTKRILLLGDSYVEAAGVSPESHMARVIEKLAFKDGISLEVISMGMSGWGQAHHLATYERLGKQFDPDIISFFVNNDLWNNESNSVWSKPIYEYEDGVLQLAMPKEQIVLTPMELLGRNILNRLESYFLLRYGVGEVYRQYFVDAEEVEIAKQAADITFDEPTDDFALAQPLAPESQLRLFEDLTKTMKKQIVDRDRRELINLNVSFAAGYKHSPKFLELLAYTEKVYADSGITSISLQSRFQTEYIETETMPHFVTDSHWNESGHRMVGEEIYKYFRLRLSELMEPSMVNER